MMKFILIALMLFLPVTVSASQGVHHNNKEKYNCSVAGKPGKIKKVRIASDAVGNGVLKLRWTDSLKAHQVQISLNGRILKTEDDGKKTITGLRGMQEVKVRGASNCGKGKWTKLYRFLP